MINAMPKTNDAMIRIRCVVVFTGKMSGRAHAMMLMPMKSIPNSAVANISLSLLRPFTSVTLG